MKTTLFALCFLLSTAAFGQSVLGGSALQGEAQPLQFSSHPQRATQQSLGQVQNVMENSTVLYAQGTRPLWEVAPASSEMPLGDAARILKKEHESAKKAKIVWNN